MTLGEAASAFGEWLGISSTDQYRLPTPTRYNCLNWVMRDYSLLFDAKYNEVSTSMTFSTSTTECAKPDNFGRPYQLYYVSNGERVYLTWYATLEEFQGNNGELTYSSEAAAPKIVCPWGESLRFLPEVDQEYTVYMDYYEITPEITDSSSTNMWLTHVPNLIILRALAEYGPLYALESDMNRTVMFKDKANDLETKYLIQAKRESGAGRRPQSREKA